MQIHKSLFRKRAAALAVCTAVLFGSAAKAFPAFDSYAAGYDKVGDGVYQMLDGTAITGVVARGIDVSHWQRSHHWLQPASS